jgi:hypothetical protein
MPRELHSHCLQEPQPAPRQRLPLRRRQQSSSLRTSPLYLLGALRRINLRFVQPNRTRTLYAHGSRLNDALTQAKRPEIPGSTREGGAERITDVTGLCNAQKILVSLSSNRRS